MGNNFRICMDVRDTTRKSHHALNKRTVSTMNLRLIYSHAWENKETIVNVTIRKRNLKHEINEDV